MLEHAICCKIRYVGKSVTSFILRLNDSRKNVKNPNAIEACKHFNTEKHQFKKQAKFTLTEWMQNIETTSTETIIERKTFG